MMPLALAAREAGDEVALATGGRFVAMLQALGPRNFAIRSARTPAAAIESSSRPHLARLWAGQGVDSPPFDAFTGDAYLDIVPPSLQHHVS
jgi:antitoxin (DNA-binding transcriptional repressor) of toxin-antitoxin stability system